MNLKSRISLLLLLTSLGVAVAWSQLPGTTPASTFPQVSTKVALSALISLTDNHLKNLAAALKFASTNETIQSGDWKQIKPTLQQLAMLQVNAKLWFALPDGRYWTVDEDLAKDSLSDRDYFPRALQGQTVLGEMVVSKSTGKSVAIVAIPVYGNNQALIGVLGASVYLDRLSQQVGVELGIDSSMIYYSFDSKPQLGMVWDETLIFKDPLQLGAEVGQAFRRMMLKADGVETYTFRGKQRTVVFKRSEITGWWYAFGLVPAGR